MTTAVESTLPAVDADAPLQRISDAVEEVQEMNSDGWALLEQLGSAAVRLKCTFSVGAEDAAAELAEYLQTIGQYEARAVAPPTDFDSWSVRAETGEVTVTEPGLTEWVRRLVAAGYANGDAELDGWALLLD